MRTIEYPSNGDTPTMSYTNTRLTLYALISALETDFRRLISTYLGGQIANKEILGEELWASASGRYLSDCDGRTPNPDLANVLEYIDFADSYQIINSHANLIPEQLRRLIKEATPRLQRIVPVRNRVMHSRPLNFNDLPIVLDSIDFLIESNIYNWNAVVDTKRNIEANPSFVLGLKIPAYGLKESNQNHNLPIPDFDETGYLGRQKQVEELVRHCVGPFPVISILGEGGIGKTALALKVAYEILERVDNPFDAVVWTSSKTTKLTPQDIVRIEGAICDSLGMFQSVAAELSGTSSEHPLEEVLEYLSQFKILLILDNLETVIDNNIREFIERIPTGSKVIITSRIGLGAYEFPVKLQSMDEGEGIQLLRSLSKIRGVSYLGELPNKTLARYCTKMKHNPGYIKWFVSAVQAGRRPEEVIDQSALFLDFCMSNVYEYLSEYSRTVLRALVAIPGKHSQAELAFLTELEVHELQEALNQLLSTNMVLTSNNSRDTYDTVYQVAELPRTYLIKNHPISSSELQKTKRRWQQLIVSSERLSNGGFSNAYSFFSLSTASKSDIVVSKYLFEAFREIRQENYTRAETLVNEARRLAPGYFEAHRVEAWLNMQKKNYSAAQSSFEAAIELKPDSAPLRLWYSSFLHSELADPEGALIQLAKAKEIDPNSADVLSEIARLKLYTSKFDEAREILDSLLERKDISERNVRKACDLNIQYYMRLAEHHVAQKDAASSLKLIKLLRRVYEGYEPNIVDAKMLSNLARGIEIAQRCANIQVDALWRKEALDIASWISYITGAVAERRISSLVSKVINKTNSSPQIEPKHDSRITKNIQVSPHRALRILGNITRIIPRKGCGFIKSADGRDFFFRLHHAKLKPGNRLSVGDKVEFEPIASENGERAIKITVIQQFNETR